MKLLETVLLKDSIEIATTPEKVWQFFTDLEQNYRAWHPEDHIVFKWTKGKPMESGSGWYAEEVMRGKVFKLKGAIGEVIPNRKIVFKYSFPISLVAPKFEWLIDPKGSTTVFTAIGYLRAGGLFYKIARKEMEWKIATHMKHVREEGEHLKRILENKPL
jgi:uncharacterized protein YndB with AHSA1/START domain